MNPAAPSPSAEARILAVLKNYMSQCEREHIARTDQDELGELIAIVADTLSAPAAAVGGVGNAVGYVMQDGTVTFYIDDFVHSRKPAPGTQLYTSEQSAPPAGGFVVDAVRTYIAANEALADWDNRPRNVNRALDPKEVYEVGRLQNAVDAAYHALRVAASPTAQSSAKVCNCRGDAGECPVCSQPDEPPSAKDGVRGDLPRQNEADSLYDESPELVMYQYLAAGQGWIECTPQVYLEMEGLGYDVRKLYTTPPAAHGEKATPAAGLVDGEDILHAARYRFLRDSGLVISWNDQVSFSPGYKGDVHLMEVAIDNAIAAIGREMIDNNKNRSNLEHKE